MPIIIIAENAEQTHDVTAISVSAWNSNHDARLDFLAIGDVFYTPTEEQPTSDEEWQHMITSATPVDSDDIFTPPNE